MFEVTVGSSNFLRRFHPKVLKGLSGFNVKCQYWTEKEAGRASRNPAGAPPARRKKQKTAYGAEYHSLASSRACCQVPKSRRLSSHVSRLQILAGRRLPRFRWKLAGCLPTTTVHAVQRHTAKTFLLPQSGSLKKCCWP